jgi:hypothetical protein
VWPAKKKGKKAKGGKKKKEGSNMLSKMKKTLPKWKQKFLDDSTRVTIIGCTSEVEEL